MASVAEVKAQLEEANGTMNEALGFNAAAAEAAGKLSVMGFVEQLEGVSSGLEARAAEAEDLPFGQVIEKRNDAAGQYNAVLHDVGHPAVGALAAHANEMGENLTEATGAQMTLAEKLRSAAQAAGVIATLLRDEAEPSVGVITQKSGEAAQNGSGVIEKAKEYATVL